MIDLKDWRLDENGRSIAYFSRNDQVVVSKEMIEELKRVSRERGYVTARLCLQKSGDSNLQDMIILAYRNQICRKLHKHTKGNEAIHMMEGRALALIFDEDQKLIDKRVLDAQAEFAYRNKNGNYHIYFPLTEYILMREIRDAKNEPGETVFPLWDTIELIQKHISQEYLLCSNRSCISPCSLASSQEIH